MKLFYVICAIALFGAFVSAEECTSDKCKPPACRCSSTELDEDIEVENTPQLVMLTFDDAVTDQISNLIMPVIDGRVNPDGCPAQVTFFVSHEYTDYSWVHKIWAKGHEMSLHSISHNPLQDYWRNITKENITAEFDDQRKMMVNLADMDEEDLQGIRVPLFQLSGDKSFQVIKDMGILYDSSWPTQSQIEPGLWPYSLDYESEQDCPLGFCPESSFPGVWVMPIMNWKDSQGAMCAMVDACDSIPSDDADKLLEWMKENFNRIYKSNRAPFGVYMHAAWFLRHENHLPVYKRFLDYMDNLPDVYFVSTTRALQYTRYPKAIDVEEREFEIFDECQRTHDPTCSPKLCQLVREDNGQERWMTSCVQKCPQVYPWLFNPYGVKTQN